MCGENQPLAYKLADAQGSPPRVRGKPVFHEMPVRRGRITPACAGKTLHHVHDLDQAEDHPRVCGENQDTPLGAYVEERITPACAGKTRLTL